MCKLNFDANMYSQKTIECALYKYAGYLSAAIERVSGKYVINFDVSSDSELSSEDLSHLIKNEVIDQSLRETIRKETEVERNLILSYTFSNTNLLD